MSELVERARELESKLNNCGATRTEISLAAARKLFEEEPSEAFEHALTGCIVTVDALLEDIEANRAPSARDGDLQIGFASYAPGKQISGLVERIQSCEVETVLQRRKILTPLINAIRGSLELSIQ